MKKEQKFWKMNLDQEYSEKKLAYLNSEHVWKENENGNIDIMAMSQGKHNGPVCINCGYDECWHCKPKPPKKCKGKK